jgi:hypothetical protein
MKEITLDASRRIITNTLWFKELLIPKEDTFKLQPRTDRFINNGRSSMLINGRVNPPRDNLTMNMVSTSKDHSTLFPNYNHTDTLT